MQVPYSGSRHCHRVTDNKTFLPSGNMQHGRVWEGAQFDFSGYAPLK
jgi:hypothetical protein